MNRAKSWLRALRHTIKWFSKPKYSRVLEMHREKDVPSPIAYLKQQLLLLGKLCTTPQSCDDAGIQAQKIVMKYWRRCTNADRHGPLAVEVAEMAQLELLTILDVAYSSLESIDAEDAATRDEVKAEMDAAVQKFDSEVQEWVYSDFDIVPSSKFIKLARARAVRASNDAWEKAISAKE